MKYETTADNVLKYSLPVFIALSLRSSVIFHPHSGENKPPMYGDYEAQRHWMEITVNLPASQWYANSSDNDLNYWGLDYPPLSAYHSWLMGKISESINASWTELHSSRGVESSEHKIFMRYTVLFSDILFFLPAVMIYFYFCLPSIFSHLKLSPFYSTCLMLSYPGIILIDHGHFQYNCISLGVFLGSVVSFLLDYDVLGSVMFCTALSYKQMELYHSLPIFFYCLGKCLDLSQGNPIKRLMKLSSTVIITFTLIFTPFLTSHSVIIQVIHRLFPVARGIYEDKVSNFWCTTSPFIKWHKLLTPSQLLWVCTLSVAAFSLPACLRLLFKPSKHILLFSLASVSMTFYLFSFQVHEKSILLVAIPTLCLLPFYPSHAFLFSIHSVLSMWPLFKKDNLLLACVCTTIIYSILGHFILFHSRTKTSKPQGCFFIYLALLSFIGYGCLILSDLFITPPLAYPDIFPLLFAAFSFFHFFILFLFLNYIILFGLNDQ